MESKDSKVSHQEAKKVAWEVVRGLLRQHPTGFVIMVLRSLNRILRSTKDLAADATASEPNQKP